MGRIVRITELFLKFSEEQAIFMDNIKIAVEEMQNNNLAVETQYSCFANGRSVLIIGREKKKQ